MKNIALMIMACLCAIGGIQAQSMSINSELELLKDMRTYTNFEDILKNDSNVTEFMGIPVDGYKPEMIKKLESKGFVYNKQKDLLEGEFNGEQVYVFVQTYKDKVWRIIVYDKEVTKSYEDIKIRFGNILSKFFNNGRYVEDRDSYLPVKGFRLYQKPEDGKYNRLVWFKVNEVSDEDYKIAFFYENILNIAKGEDL